MRTFHKRGVALALSVVLGLVAGQSIAAQSEKRSRSTKKSEKAESQSPSTAKAGGKVDLNAASEKELVDLPGIGEASAKKIIASRPYGSVADLSRAGISEKTIEKISSMVTVSGSARGSSGQMTKSSAGSSESAARPAPAASGAAQANRGQSKADVNTASEKDLEDLPGIGPASAKKIIASRPYSSVADLSKAGISAKTMEKINDLVVAGGSSGNAGSGSARMTPSAEPPARTAPMPPAAGSNQSRSMPSAPAGMPPASSGSNQTRTPAAPASETPYTPPPSNSKGMVWVNLETGVYHYTGSRYYGKTKSGKYMAEGDATKAGYHAAKNEHKP